MLENLRKTLEDTRPLRSPPNNRRPVGVLSLDARGFLSQLQRGTFQIGWNRMRDFNGLRFARDWHSD